MTKSNNQQLAVQERQNKVLALFDERKEELQTMLAPGVDADRFVRTFKNALIRDPKIAEADRQTIFLECQKAAQDGLVLDGREAVLTRFNTNRRVKEGNTWRDNWIVEVVYIPMVLGIMKRARNTGQIATWNVSLVYEGELTRDPETGKPRFRYIAGDAPRIDHEPIIFGERGDVVAVYSSVKLTDGTYHHEVMTVDDVNNIMKRTKSKKSDGTIVGPWANDWAEMAKKTVIRRHAKRLPMSGTDFSVASRVDALYDFEPNENGTYSDPELKSPSAQNKRKGSAAAKLKAAAQEPDTEQEPDEPDDAIQDADYTEVDEGQVDGGEQVQSGEGQGDEEDPF